MSLKKRGAIQYDIILKIIIGLIVVGMAVGLWFAFDAGKWVKILPDYQYNDKDTRIDASDGSDSGAVIMCPEENRIGKIDSTKKNGIIYINDKESNLRWDKDRNVIRIMQGFPIFDLNRDAVIADITQRKGDLSRYLDSEGKLDTNAIKTREMVLASGLTAKEFSLIHNAFLYGGNILCNKNPIVVGGVLGITEESTIYLDFTNVELVEESYSPINPYRWLFGPPKRVVFDFRGIFRKTSQSQIKYFFLEENDEYIQFDVLFINGNRHNLGRLYSDNMIHLYSNSGKEDYLKWLEVEYDPGLKFLTSIVPGYSQTNLRSDFNKLKEEIERAKKNK